MYYCCTKNLKGRIMKRILNWFRFWVFWLTSAGLNFFILAVIRQFYMTDDVHSDYFNYVASKIDSWVILIIGFSLIILVLLLNTFYKDQAKVIPRFGFISSLQLILLGLLRLASAPFAVKFASDFPITAGYILSSIGFLAAGFVLYFYTIRRSLEKPKDMLKKLFKILEFRRF